MDKKIDKRVQKTKHAIYIAFVELLNEKDVNQITITDIAKKANISENDTAKAVKNLPFPLTIKESGSGELMYRIEGPYMYVPPLLMLLRGK